MLINCVLLYLTSTLLNIINIEKQFAVPKSILYHELNTLPVYPAFSTIAHCLAPLLLKLFFKSKGEESSNSSDKANDRVPIAAGLSFVGARIVTCNAIAANVELKAQRSNIQVYIDSHYSGHHGLTLCTSLLNDTTLNVGRVLEEKWQYSGNYLTQKRHVNSLVYYSHAKTQFILKAKDYQAPQQEQSVSSFSTTKNNSNDDQAADFRSIHAKESRAVLLLHFERYTNEMYNVPLAVQLSKEQLELCKLVGNAIKSTNSNNNSNNK